MIAILGAGKMGEALLSGMLRAGVAPAGVIAAARREDRAQARLTGRSPADFEYQMLYGIRPAEQRRLAAEGARMRVYVPYGSDWYGYLVRRLAERPANLAFFVRSLITRS